MVTVTLSLTVVERGNAPSVFGAWRAFAKPAVMEAEWISASCTVSDVVLRAQKRRLAAARFDERGGDCLSGVFRLGARLARVRFLQARSAAPRTGHLSESSDPAMSLTAEGLFV